MTRNYAERYLDNMVTLKLLSAMRDCRELGRSFTFCLAAARKEFNKESRERADATPLDKPA